MRNILDYVDEVKVRLQRYQVSTLDDLSILTLVNRARRQVEFNSYNIYPERFSDVVTLSVSAANFVTHADVNSYSGIYERVYIIYLPMDTIDVSNVILKHPEMTDVECAPVTLEELYELCKNSYTAPTLYSPIYALNRSYDSTLYELWIAGISWFDSTVQCSEPDVDVYYIKGLTDMQLHNGATSDIDTVIPDFLEELVIYYAMLFCVQTLDTPLTVLEDIQNMINVIKENFVINTNKI